jgi:[ribosomal protein S18]-alanine N-acetyltransferase
MSAADISIRPMTLADLPQVGALDRACFTLPWPENSYRFELTQNPASRCWVVVAAPDEVIGVLVMWLIEDEAHIATIAIRPDYRGQGLGRRLLAEGLNHAIERNMTSATLEVREHNEGAIRLYEQFGFEIVGRRKRYYHDTNEDALIMTASHLNRDT